MRHRQVGAVVQQERDAARLGDRQQRLDRPADGVVVDVLQPDLQRRHVAGIERRGQQVGEAGRSRAGGVIR